MKIYIASEVLCSEPGDPGEVRQTLHTDLDAAKKHLEINASYNFMYTKSDYSDLGWSNQGNTLTYQSEEARDADEYSYCQIDIVDTDSLSKSEILLAGI